MFVDSCQRGNVLSRTYLLAQAFISSYKSDGNEIETVVLRDMNLLPLKAEDVVKRETLIDEDRLGDESLALARQFARADRILIAAPYWDLMFPAALKTYIEHVCVRKISFAYVLNSLVGLCKADKLAYITTAGGDISDDLGSAYIRSLCRMWGIESFYGIAAMRLDEYGYDVPGELARARDEALQLGAEFAK